MAQPPGKLTFAWPKRASSGPRASTLARIVLTKLVRCLKDLDVSRRHLVRPKLGRQNGRPEVLEQTPLRDQVLYIRDVVKRNRFRRQKRRRKARQGRIFCTADLDLSSQRIAAAN